MRLAILTLITALFGLGPVWADGLTLATPGGPNTQGQCYASGTSGPRVPCVLQGQTWTRVLRPTDPADGMTVGGTALPSALAGKHPLNATVSKDATSSEQYPWQAALGSGQVVTQYAGPTGVGLYDTLRGIMWAYDPRNGKLTLPNVNISGSGSTGQVDGMSVLGRALSDRARDVINIKDYGAIGDGQSHPLSERFQTLAAAQAVYGPYATALSREIDTVAEAKAIDIACQRSGGLVSQPQGIYRRDATVTLPCSNVTVVGAGDGATIIHRRGDFGPSYYVGGPSGYITRTAISNMQFVDADGSMTLANSPYHVEYEGLSNADMANVTAASGTGVLRIRASDQVRVSFVYGLLRAGAPTQTVGGTTYDRTAFYIGPSSKTALQPYNAQSSDIFFTSVNVKARDPSDATFGPWHAAYGLHITAVDGFWMADSHFEGTLKANVRLQRTTTGPLGNVYVRNTMSDIAAAHGWLLDGSYPVTRTSIEGQVSSDLQGNAGGNGFYITGTGGADDISLDLGVEGVKGDAIKIDASAVTNVVIRPKSIKRLISTSAGINLSGGSHVRVVGGNIGGDFTLGTGVIVQNAADVTLATGISNTNNYGYYIAASTNVSVTGGPVTGSLGYGGYIGTDATNISVVGVPHTGNQLGAINMPGGPRANVLLANNLGM